ncbi:N-acetylmuramoyl-L-alanine amidase [Streptomyces sp. KAU_LT]|uniref:peptidoglycan recognition protein family protein n=1 Tax=Streptomyces sp. KAU_LT TaxID=3046669 RepID=UPI0024B64F95|nr:N-acetylmuramoyl-L-alanine amidase [Streptomyces sp. KAU_LT]MDI9829671.1 N-acetylmuramoyl-L-alanine amidase [Streptomyces sp. KAU_LT]
MADPMTPAQWRAALRAEGVPFTELDGWTTRGRDKATGKVFGPVRGSLNHHTAGRDSLRVIAYDGQGAEVPAPLAHAYLPKSGRLVLVAAGRANHAGLAARNAFDAIVAEKAIPKPSKASGTVDGNDALYGIETENLGDGKDTYTRAQYDTWVRYNAAICRHHGWSEGSAAGHLETSVEGKVDPSGPVEGYGRRGRFQFTMAQLRADVEERLAHPASWSPQQPADSQAVTLTGPAYVHLGLTDSYQLPPGGWDEVAFTQEWMDELGHHPATSEVFVVGPARFTASLSLRLERLPVGGVVQVRMSEWEGATLKTLHPIHEVLGTPGGSYAAVPLVARLGAGRSMRLRLLNQSADGIEVARAELTGLVWKES